MNEIIKIGDYILQSFIHIWPFLLVTIPLSVAVKSAGISKYINKAFTKNPWVSILLATMVGAFSPFCSCGVIPVISSLLIGGVPIAPVMSFWIASPSMDPEIFFLSTASIGWNLAAWRLVSTFMISLMAGLITQLAYSNGFLGDHFLKTGTSPSGCENRHTGLINSRLFLKKIFSSDRQNSLKLQPVCTASAGTKMFVDCCIRDEGTDCPAQGCMPETIHACSSASGKTRKISTRNIIHEILQSTWLVVKFMSIAFLLNALMTFYVPTEFIQLLLAGGGTSSVFLATIIGIPAYTSNITALPLVGSLLSLGMDKGAALAFLIAGATTTLPAMAAVWGIVKRRVFILYLTCSIAGALLSGLLFNFFNS